MSAGLSTGPQAMQVGDIALRSVLDAVGLLASCDEAYPDVAIERWDPFRPVYPALFSGNDWRLPVACTVIRSAGTTVLVDAGVGPPGGWSWDGEREGLLPEGLAAAGIEPANVDTVFFTHLHVDHVGWLADSSVFANARIVVSSEALAYALEHSPVEWLPGRLRDLVAGHRIDTVSAGDELVAGVRTVAYPGHYPGHLGLEVESGGARALLIGDTAPHPALLDQPDWQFRWDHDAPLACETRAAFLRDVVDTDTLVVCGHYPGSGMGRIVRRSGQVLWEEAA